MKGTKTKIAVLLAGALLVFSVYELVGVYWNPVAHERDYGIESNRKYEMGDDNIPKVLFQFEEDQVFALKEGKKHYLYRFKSFLKVTAVDYIVDKDGNFISKATPIMMFAGSRIFFEDTTMVHVDYCPKKFESFDDARQAVLDDKVVWIEDLIRPPSAFKGDIKAIKSPE